MTETFNSAWNALTMLHEEKKLNWYDTRPSIYYIIEKELKSLPNKKAFYTSKDGFSVWVDPVEDGYTVRVAVDGEGRNPDTGLRNIIWVYKSDVLVDQAGLDKCKEDLLNTLKTDPTCIKILEVAAEKAEEEKAKKDQIKQARLQKLADATQADPAENDFDKGDQIYTLMCRNEVELLFQDVKVTLEWGNRDYWDGSYDHHEEKEIDWPYTVSEGEICEAIIQDHSGEFLKDVSEADPEFECKLWAYMYENFDDLFDEYEDEIYDHYRAAAEEDAQENAE